VPLEHLRTLLGQGATVQACADLHNLAIAHPRDADVLALYGWALFDLASYTEARAALSAALHLRPDHPEALNTMGALATSAADPEEAVAWFEQALETEPGDLGARYNLAQALFVAGEYRRGFDLLRARHQLLFGKPNVLAPLPAWAGESLQGRHVFVWCDWGGLGDHLQFVRYVALLHERARPARLTLGAGREFSALFARIPGVDAVVEYGHVPEADVHCPLLDLPYYFGTDVDSVPARIPYLDADPALAGEWAQQLRAAGLPPARLPPDASSTLRVGLAWKSAGPANEVRVYQRMRVSKSIPPGMLAALGGPRTAFVSLQVGADAAEHAATGLAIIDRTDDIGDFAATAAIIANLDLVVSADTSVAHLAAAMGKPVLLLLRHESGLFWLRGRDDSPWYPTLRILRQEHSGDWAPVLAAARGWLDRAREHGAAAVIPLH
jgi:Glycosyltransferase family 9 (heptosyltransferase)/Tetratricopeptide repeat